MWLGCYISSDHAHLQGVRMLMSEHPGETNTQKSYFKALAIIALMCT